MPLPPPYCLPVDWLDVDPADPSAVGPLPDAYEGAGLEIDIPRKVCVAVVTTAYGTWVTSATTEYQRYRLPPGTEAVGAPFCRTDETGCCPTATVPCCPDPVPYALFLTISDGGGSFPIVNDGSGNWDTGDITIPGCGTISVRLYCFGSDETGWTLNDNSYGLLDYTVAFSGYVRSCDPFSVAATGTLTGAGPCADQSFTFTVTT